MDISMVMELSGLLLLNHKFLRSLMSLWCFHALMALYCLFLAVVMV